MSFCLHLLQRVPEARPSIAILLLMLLVVAASFAIFWLLVKRWTDWRKWTALSEWAGSNEMELHHDPTIELPQPLRQIEPPLQVLTLLRNDDTMLLQAHNAAPAEGRLPPHEGHWHLLVRRMEAPWPPTGLRPAAHARSLLDLMPLSSYPSLIPPERYVVFGTESAAARILAESSLRALLPADIGLLLHGSYMILDFSPRPFDPIDLGRLLALSDQLASHVPLVSASQTGKPA
jgi:hypothetical protein